VIKVKKYKQVNNNKELVLKLIEKEYKGQNR